MFDVRFEGSIRLVRVNITNSLPTLIGASRPGAGTKSTGDQLNASLSHAFGSTALTVGAQVCPAHPTSPRPLRKDAPEHQSGEWIAHGHTQRFYRVVALIALWVQQPLLNKKGCPMDDLQPQSELCRLQ